MAPLPCPFIRRLSAHRLLTLKFPTMPMNTMSKHKLVQMTLRNLIADSLVRLTLAQ